MLNRTVALLTVATCAAAYAGCSDPAGEPMTRDYTTPGPHMRPGQNCLSCHRPAEQGGTAPVWSAGGTVFPSADAAVDQGVEGAIVTITDSKGKKVDIVTNAVGNFYTSESLTGPLKVSLAYQGRKIDMPGEAPAGSCNFCHDHPNPVGPKGRIYVP